MRTNERIIPISDYLTEDLQIHNKELSLVEITRHHVSCDRINKLIKNKVYKTKSDTYFILTFISVVTFCCLIPWFIGGHTLNATLFKIVSLMLISIFTITILINTTISKIDNYNARHQADMVVFDDVESVMIINNGMNITCKIPDSRYTGMDTDITYDRNEIVFDLDDDEQPYIESIGTLYRYDFNHGLGQLSNDENFVTEELGLGNVCYSILHLPYTLQDETAGQYYFKQEEEN